MILTSLLRRVSLKHIKHQKTRTIIAIFGIALGGEKNQCHGGAFL